MWASTVYGTRAGDGTHEGSGAYLLTFADWQPVLTATPRIFDDWHQYYMHTLGGELSLSEAAPGAGVAFLMATAGGDAGGRERGGDAETLWAIAAFEAPPSSPTGATAADTWIDVDLFHGAQPRWTDLDADGLDDLFIAHAGAAEFWTSPLKGHLSIDDASTLAAFEGAGNDLLDDAGTDLHDVNGDGHPDLVASGGNEVHVFFGPLPSRTDWSAGDIVYRTGAWKAYTFAVDGLKSGWHPESFGYPFGDFTGDGEPDLAFVPDANDVPENLDNWVSVAWDHTTGTHDPGSGTLLVSVQHQDKRAWFDGAANLGDVTGDGVSDLWLGAVAGRAGWRNVLVPGPIDHDLLIDPSGASEGVAFELDEDAFSTFVFPAGDLDADGLGDFALTWSTAYVGHRAPMSLILFRGCENW